MSDNLSGLAAVLAEQAGLNRDQEPMSRRLLQITNILLALLTIGLAGASLVFGADHPLYPPGEVPAIPSLDSNLRFMGGMGLGLGLALLWVVPSIEKHGTVFRLVWLCALLGGLGRLWSWMLVGTPPLPVVLFTVIEVPGVPLLIYWQHRVARSYFSTAKS